jgi:hypothetical protein
VIADLLNLQKMMAEHTAAFESVQANIDQPQNSLGNGLIPTR